MTYRLLVTGTRYGRFDAQEHFQYMIDTFGEPVLWIFGDALGVDSQCKDFCECTNRPFQKFDRDWKEMDGPAVNKIMAEFTAEVPNSKCLALPLPGSRGTLNCIEKAEKQKLHVVRR